MALSVNHWKYAVPVAAASLVAYYVWRRQFSSKTPKAFGARLDSLASQSTNQNNPGEKRSCLFVAARLTNKWTDTQAFQKLLKTEKLGRSLSYFKEVDSTMNLAKAARDQHGAMFLAEAQTAGLFTHACNPPIWTCELSSALNRTSLHEYSHVELNIHDQHTHCCC
jgi:hypothetical protein